MLITDPPCTPTKKWYKSELFNRTGVAGAVLQSPPSPTDSLIDWSFSSNTFQNGRARELKFWENVHPTLYEMCHVSCVRCHLSPVTCHVSPVTFQNICFKQNCIIKKNPLKYWKSGEAWRWRVCYQRGLPRLVLSVRTKWKVTLKTLKKYFKFLNQIIALPNCLINLLNTRDRKCCIYLYYWPWLEGE